MCIRDSCNTATSACVPLLREKYPIDIIGMEPALKAVSYTHLDVYKRQAMQKAAKNITDFHQAQRQEGYRLQKEMGIYLGQRVLPLELSLIHIYTKEDAKEDVEEKTESSQQNPVKDVQGSNNAPETSSDSNSSSSDNAISWSQSDPLSVDETLQYGDLLQKSGQSVWLQGDLPQAMTSGGMILYNGDHSTFISIEDPMHLIDFGGTNAMIVGKIKQQGSSYCVVVEKAYAL